MADLLVLAHVLSQDNPWIPLMTVSAIAVVVVFALAVAGRLVVDEPGDLLLPLASVVLVAGLASSSVGSADWLLDQGPWLVPVGLVLVTGLVLAAVRDDVDLAAPGRRAAAVLGLVAAIAGGAGFVPLDRAWFGEEDPMVFAVDPVDAAVRLVLVEPPDAEGRFVVEVTVTGGTIGDNVPRATRPVDVEQEMAVKFLVNGQPRFPAVPAECASDPDCTTARFALVHAVGEPLETVEVELLTADQVAFSSRVGDTLSGEDLTAETG